MTGFGPIDAMVLIAYLVAITALGVWSSRRVKTLTDFFMPRRFGKVMMIMNAFGTGTASDQAVSVASATFRSGLSGIWYQWLWLLATPFYWVIAPIFRRFRAVTTADVYVLRYDRSVAVLFAVVGVVSMSVKIGVMLKGIGALVASGTGAKVDPALAMAVTAGLFVFYGAAGGLAAAIMNDFIQGILTLFFSFVLLPFVLYEVSGLSGIRAAVPDPAMLSLVAPGKITAFFVVMMAIQALVGIVAQPHFMGVCAAGKTEFDGRVGVLVGNLIKRLCTVAWCLTGIAAVAWYIQRGVPLASINGDHVYGDLAQAFLPRTAPGLLGLFVAAMLAGVMSACSAFMLSSAALFTQNIYKPVVAGRSAAHYIWVGRAASVAIVLGGLGFALWVPNVVRALELWFMIAPMMGVTFWMGLLWRRMNAAGAWAATLSGFAVWLLTTQRGFIAWVGGLPVAESWRLIWIEENGPTIFVPWQIVAYMTAAVAAGLVVSLLTPPGDPKRLDLFYALTRTPSVPGEKILEPCTLPEGVTPAPRKMLLESFGLEVPRPSKTSVAGFLVGCGLAVALVVGFCLLMRL